jgi:hypothetical protein
MTTLPNPSIKLLKQRALLATPDARPTPLKDQLTHLLLVLCTVFEVTIGLRVLLKLMDASPTNALAHFIEMLSQPLVAPFMGLTTATLTAGGMSLEIFSVVALIVYALDGWVFARLITLLFDRPQST